MAFGTPVSGAIAYSSNNGTSVSPAYPTGILTTDLVILVVGQKPSTANSGTVTTPTGWTLREELLAQGGYGTTLGNGTGNVNARIYTWDSPVAGQTGNRVITVGTNNICWARITRVPTGGGALSFGTADAGQNATPASAWTLALTNGATATNFKTNDFAYWAFVTAASTGAAFSAHTITATGATFSAATEIGEATSTTGNDIGGFSAYATVSSGTSTAAPTVGATIASTANVRGPVVLLRAREIVAYTIDAASGSFTYTGQAATLTPVRAVSADAGSFSYTGQAATLASTRIISADAGAFTYTGQDATLTSNRSVSADAGFFIYLGQAATLTAAKTFSADAGTFTYTGQDATLTSNRSVSADVGTFVYEGQSATLTYSTVAAFDAGAFTYTGQNVTLLLNRSFSADAGAFTYTGQSATLVVARTPLSADAGAFTYTGQNATLVPTQVVSAAAGAFTYTGQTATLVSARLLSSNAGTFTYTGQPATLVVVRVPLSADAGAFAYTGQSASLTTVRLFSAGAGVFTYTGEPATLTRTSAGPTVLNAEAGAFGEANPYVNPGYVNPYYSTNLTATLAVFKIFTASAGAFSYTGQDATLQIGTNYPPVDRVRQGVVYGPGGIYTGTYVITTRKPVYVFDD